jgi:hypothetical protein
MIPPSSHRALASSIEPLESRIAPANLVAVNAATKTATWTDWDGDLVTLKWTGAAAPTFVSEDSGGLTLLVDKITLTNANDALTLTVKAFGSGDGRIDLGHLDATGIALKSWSSPKATIAEFDCGDTVNGIGSYLSGGIGIVPHTKFAGSTGDGVNDVKGAVGSFTVRGDLAAGQLAIAAGAGGKIGSVTFTGSIRGDAPVAGILNGNLTITTGKLGSLTIGGSIIGGDGNSEGNVSVTGSIGKALVKGSLIGGSNSFTGQLSLGEVKSFVIGGNVVGGSAKFSGFGGALSATSFTLGGSIVGGTEAVTGVLSFNAVQTAVIKGSIIGTNDVDPATNGEVATLDINGAAGSITLYGDLIAGTVHTAGAASYNGAILVKDNVASITIKGSVLGNNDTRAYILAQGVAPAKPGNYNAIGKLTVGGDVEHAYIAAGQGVNLSAFADRIGDAETPDAGIGSVTVGGNWLHSNLTAGINDADSGGFDAGDTRDAGDPTRQAVIGPVQIKGDLLDDPFAFGFSGFGAEKIASITAGGVKVFTTGAADRFLDFYHFVRVGEV